MGTASGYSYGQKNCIFGIFDDGTSEEDDDDDEEDEESTEDDEDDESTEDDEDDESTEDDEVDEDSAETVTFCGNDYAYHSGTMINDDAEANSPQACSEECKATEDCAYWDYEVSSEICRLRSNAGSGKQTASGYSYGQKNCIFGKTVYETDMQQEVLHSS